MDSPHRRGRTTNSNENRSNGSSLATVPVSTGPKRSNLLVSLSKSCRNHQDKHESDDQTYFCEDFAQVPLFCRESLSALERALPKVEKAYQNNPHPQDVRHLCDFYGSVLNGGFCPNAPHLFRSGAVEILPRVYYLFQQLVAKAVLQETLQYERQNKSQPLGTAISNLICTTIADFLTTMTELKLQQAVINDLLDLLVHLTTITDLTTEPKEIVLLSETIHRSGLPDTTKYSIFITDALVLVALQGHLWDIIGKWGRMMLQKRLRPRSSVPIPSLGRADLVLPVELDRFIEATYCTTIQAFVRTMDDNMSLWILKRYEAMWRVLQALVEDAQTTANAHVIYQVGRCMGEIIPTFMQLRPHVAIISSQRIDQQLESTLAKLLLQPTTPSNLRETYQAVERVLLTSLLRSLAHFKASPSTLAKSKDQSYRLETVIFKTIVGILSRVQPRSLVFTEHNFSQAIVATLFRSLGDAQLHQDAVSILTNVLETIENFRHEYLQNICNDGTENIHREDEGNDSDDLAQHGRKRNRPVGVQSERTRRSNASIDVSSPGKSRKLSIAEDSTVFGILYGEMARYVSKSQDAVKRIRDVCSTSFQQEHQKKNLQSQLALPSLAMDVVLTVGTLQIFDFIIQRKHIPSPHESSDHSCSLSTFIQDAVSVLRELYGIVHSITFDPTTHTSKTTILQSLCTFRVLKLTPYVAKTLDADVEESLHRYKAVLVNHFGLSKVYSIDGILSIEAKKHVDEGLSRQHDDSANTFLYDQRFQSIFSPMTRDHETQRWRINVLLSCTQSTVVSSEDLSLSQATFDLLLNEQIDSSDPLVRLLRWQSLAWLFMETNKLELHRLTSATLVETRKELIQWFLDVAFGDELDFLREYTSTHLGMVLSSNDYSAILVTLADDKDWHIFYSTNELNNPDFTNTTRHIVENLFSIVDSMLSGYCGIPQSQLSFSVKSISSDNISQRSTRTLHRVASRCLTSICQYATMKSLIGRMLFEHAFARAVRLWVGVHEENSGSCFGELSRLAAHVDLGLVLRTSCARLGHGLFRDILVPRRGTSDIGVENLSPATIEARYRVLEDFLRRALAPSCSPGGLLSCHYDADNSDLEQFLQHSLPVIMAHFIVEKDYDTLRLTTGFKVYLLAKRRLHEQVEMKLTSDAIVRGDISVEEKNRAKGSKRNFWTRDLARQTRELCLAPGMIDRLLPWIFMKGGRSELLFFMKDVLHNKMTLKTTFDSREQLILKSFVWELTEDPSLSRLAERAIVTAALARGTNCKEGDDTGVGQQGHSAATDWISSHFMYLLVNVVQHKWNSRSSTEKIHALRCLHFMLRYLKSSESSQYFPQILATINNSITDSARYKASEDSALLLEIRFLATEAFFTFVKLVASDQPEVLGQNLTAIVVSLIPLFSTDVDRPSHVLEESNYLSNASSKVAVSILEFLTEDSLGARLAGFFNEIPFLPPSPLLDPLRTKLRNLGVDFDNLSVSITQTTQGDIVSSMHRSNVSDNGSTATDGKSSVSSVRRQGALRKRLDIICSLLGNENVSIRQVVLDHLLALLRANRELFYALVQNDGVSSTRRYLTIVNPDRSGSPMGSVSVMMGKLLLRCVQESDISVRTLLASCLGELGAIGMQRLEDIQFPRQQNEDEVHFGWTLSQPPWQSHPARYELTLVSKNLVTALKAALTSSEQHKVAFSIQQLLVLLDKYAQRNVNSTGNYGMNDWLSGKLSEARVLDIVEPFWSSEFHEVEVPTPQQPPFFSKSADYFTWITMWTRFMVIRSHERKSTPWTQLFYACRTAIRTRAGLSIAELLLPLLVLDRMCFGDGHDEQAIFREISETLAFREDVSSRMSNSERRKAVNVVFNLIDTLQYWSEQETEQRYNKEQSSASKRGDHHDQSTVEACDWPVDESVMRIDDLLEAIPLGLRARGASRVGMHARALRLLEMFARKSVVEEVFNGNDDSKRVLSSSRSRAAGFCPSSEVDLMKKVLAELRDYDTAAALHEDNYDNDPQSRIRDNIRLKEAKGDWEGALQDYERALQLLGEHHREPLLSQGALRCLLELGHFESVISQVNGMLFSDSQINELSAAIPLGVEAAWRLGRWEKLSELVSKKFSLEIDSEAAYRLSMGRIMLGFHDKNPKMIASELVKARTAVMENLSSSAREGYGRSYDNIVSLHSLREIEDASEVLCKEDDQRDLAEFSNDPGGGSWDNRLSILSSVATTPVMNIRLALARLAGDPYLESSLFLNLGKRARKAGLYGIASNAFAQAEAALGGISVEARADAAICTLKIQLAKLKYETGDTASALRLLGLEKLEDLADLNASQITNAASTLVGHMVRKDAPHIGDEASINVFVRSALLSTKWYIDGGLKPCSEIMNRFRVIHRASPNWEKGHFQYAKYIHSALRSRITALKRKFSQSNQVLNGDEDFVRGRMISEDKVCQKYVALAVKHFAEALILDTKHVYEALPRLLSLWFEFTSIHGGTSELDQYQEEVNTQMAAFFVKIPAHAFYTALPQLVSNVVHSCRDTAIVVHGILTRVLVKYPHQAMWHLAWLRQSKVSDRKRIGESIFQNAEKSLAKHSNDTAYKVLVSSKSFLTFLHDLARYQVTDTSTRSITLKPWSGEVQLWEFIPPVQAALSVAIDTSGGNRSKDLFPRQVPRIRAFSSKVGVMTSKAKPKKLKAYVVPSSLGSKLNAANKEYDLGELHFLVKQEAKGDLRKDARVQDLNHVINRLMASSDDTHTSNRQSRRLNLRTYSVTCLSEDTGILEWVPNTASMRSLIAQAYNPQASPFSSKRRGSRVTNLNNATLRNTFEKKCQSMFLQNGDLKRAAALFESLLLKAYPPLLYWWFVQNFQDPHAWYEARSRFALSCAAWSAVGHVIGLGDRHSENILIDTTTGDCVHVDFDCIFDKGLHLPRPEVVPFRLTINMVDAFGPTGTDGVYTGAMKSAMQTLRDNRDTLLSVLEPFVKDPIIEWKRQRSSDLRQSNEKQIQQAKRSIHVIDERLCGVYNLQNPSAKKASEQQKEQDDSKDEWSHLSPLSVEGQVHKMISEATSSENLVQLFVGWMPWV